jgi:hypothetical protein
VPVGYQLIAGDHDFHVVNLTARVTLLADIKPTENNDGGLPSFYNKGKMYDSLFHSI